MKASESVKNYPSSLRMYTNYTVREIKKVCQTIGPRASGSENERKAQEHFAEEMKTCCDKVEIEDFKMSKYAFMAWVIIDAVFATAAVALSFFVPVVSLVLVSLALICTFAEFLKYWEFLEPFFPKATACNTVGVRAPKGEVKQRIVFSGHTDSAYEWTYTYLGGKNLLFGVAVPAFVGLAYVFVAAILSLVFGGENQPAWLDIVQYIQFVFIPVFIAVLFFTNFKRPVMGANDNLTGAVAAIAILKYLEDNGIRFENTEVVALTTGCEEAGLRGAKAYTKKHLDELKAIPTAFIGMDTLKDYKDIAIYERDMTGTVKNDARVCALLKKGAERAGLDLPFESVYFGASDAARVSTLGVPAATLAAMDPGPPRYYHTRLDTIEELEMKTVEKCLDVCLQTLFIFDEYGLKENYDEVEVEGTPVSPKA